MFFDRDIRGDLLPPGTLCLTYDDGPGATRGRGSGPDTRGLARLLHSEGVPATFFAVGRHAEGRARLLRQLREWGHLVGNHTWSHPGLVALALAGGDVVGEIALADAVLRAGYGRGPVFFRAPYGNWRETEGPGGPDKPVSIVAGRLNAGRRFPRHVGPINWDVCAEDWECWRLGLSAEEGARRYLAEVERRGRGIVLMHDSSEDEAVRGHNRTAAMTKLLVPALKRRGYRFVRLDDIPQVRSAARVVDQISLGTAVGRRFPDPLGVVPLRDGRFALRAGNGRYLSARDDRVLPVGIRVGEREAFEMRRLPDGLVAFRTTCGAYVSLANNSGELNTHTGRPGAAESYRVRCLSGGHFADTRTRTRNVPIGPAAS